MNSATSRYRVRACADGFCVEGDDRPPVEVRFRGTALEACHLASGGVIARERFGFFNFGKLLEFVARGLMRDWQPQDGWFGARAWAEQQTARALARRLRELWLALVARADPAVAAVHKAIFAATFSDAPLAAEPGLYRDRFLVQDILHYPAAAIAVRNAWVLTRELPLARLHGSLAAGQLRALAQSLGLHLHLAATPLAEPDVPAQLERLRHWKALFSDTGEAYRSLNRTLMNLPGRVPHRLVCQLRRVHLERPLDSRLELLAVVLYAGIRAARSSEDDALFTEQVAASDGRADHSHLFMHARAAALREAMRRVAQHLHQPLTPRRAGDVRQFVQFLADCPQAHAGNVVGLAERAIRWHREAQQEQLAAMRRQHGADTPTSRPPIPLPEQPQVRFLDTVGAVCSEAEVMQHCVASYIDLAVQGNCYLFHVHYKGEDATVEVGCEGKVRQSQGPRNQRNRASAWGRRTLARWATRLPPPPFTGRRQAWAAGEQDEEIPF
jgi:hypothetical protein